MQLRTPIAGRAFAAHSRPNAIDRLAEADTGAAVAQSSGRTSTPTPHRFIGDVEPALGQQFLHVAVAQREAEIEPDRVLDDLGRKTMAAIAERNDAATLTLRAALARPVSVTTP
jgi:hypothetical protein